MLEELIQEDPAWFGLVGWHQRTQAATTTALGYEPWVRQDSVGLNPDPATVLSCGCTASLP